MLYKTAKRSRALSRFIRDNREEIDTYIRSKGIDTRLNDEDRQQWVNNDELLYNRARAWGWRG